MGGSNFVHHAAGMLDSMLTAAYEQYVIDDEIIGMCGKVLKGIDVDSEHLALEVIDAVGPGGSFMIADHTLDHLRSEYYLGNGITDQKDRELWEKDGALDARSRGRQIAKNILVEEERSYMPPDVDQTIRERFNILLP
jgi:trimethylamine--corrinoid protein Co-methyltransferase